MSTIKELRESLTHEQIKEVLMRYNLEPVHESPVHMQLPTACHDLDFENHSPKLWYYDNSHMFRCFSDECGSFDLFQLIQKMETLRGNECSLPEALKIAGFSTTEYVKPSEERLEDLKSIEYLSKMNSIVTPRVDYRGLGNNILDNYVYNEDYLKPWIDEGVTPEALRAFDIRYSTKNLAIVIPHRDKDGNIIGVRGRFMAQDAPAKYMPLSQNGVMMAHSLRGNLYGLYENKNVIQKNRTVILFESEKSVLKFSSFFGHENNFSVATCGNKVTNEQIQLLHELGVKRVILAFDKDYQDPITRKEIQENYNKIGNRLSVYFNTSIIFDFGNVLGYKDAPIDKGRAVFEELFKYAYDI